MKETARRQILEDMGLVPWRLRAAEAGVRATATEPAPVSRSAPPGPAPEARPEPEAARRAPPSLAVEPPPAAPQPPPSVAEPRSQPAAEPWAALSLALPGVVMLVDGAASRRDLRLAMDVLAAAAGDWNAKPASRRFDWPPPVATPTVAMDDESSRRALLAFAGKDVADHGAALLVCVASVAQRLPAGEPGCRRLVVPDLEELGREPAAKRSLWYELSSIRP